MKPAPGAAFIPAPEPEWRTQVVELPNSFIQLVCVTFEGYDNLAMVRTPVKGRGRVYVTFEAPRHDEVLAVLDDLQRWMPMRLGQLHEQMLEDTWVD